MKLDRSFFEQPTLKVAKSLLGKIVIRKYKNKLLIGKIVETEAYLGPKDKASHAYSFSSQSFAQKLKVLNDNWRRIKWYVNNKELFYQRILKCPCCKVTNRNLAEYLRGGHVYIYLIYGNHYQFNITSFGEGCPECILIRSLEPMVNLVNPKGPGRLCHELKLGKKFWGHDLVTSNILWLEDNNISKKEKIVARPRIGIDYAQEVGVKNHGDFI
ncbi:MAG: putative 3-methyladenine DNA glycosylase [Candidatus Parcubacteria bacterium]|nr:MAG: putative 3-methyladenine DNA glycosylase [Candidatus Parcubacteria bacterium]